MVESLSQERLAGACIETHSLGMVYDDGDGTVHALQDVSLAIPRGQFVVVRGKSGSGKSSLFNLLAGMRRPSSGTVKINDTEISQFSERDAARFRRRNLGLVYQFFNLVPILDVAENIALPLLLDGLSSQEVQGRVDELLEHFQISHRSKHPIGKLSGGEMQRVAIARAMIADPVLVLADEPTGNLDELNAGIVLKALGNLSRENGRTLVMMTHDVSALDFCDRVIKLRDGKIEDDLGPF